MVRLAIGPSIILIVLSELTLYQVRKVEVLLEMQTTKVVMPMVVIEGIHGLVVDILSIMLHLLGQR